jgi:hypothetical protein
MNIILIVLVLSTGQAITGVSEQRYNICPGPAFMETTKQELSSKYTGIVYSFSKCINLNTVKYSI